MHKKYKNYQNNKNDIKFNIDFALFSIKKQDIINGISKFRNEYHHFNRFFIIIEAKSKFQGHFLAFL
jgi:hypothetical protein